VTTTNDVTDRLDRIEDRLKVLESHSIVRYEDIEDRLSNLESEYHIISNWISIHIHKHDVKNTINLDKQESKSGLNGSICEETLKNEVDNLKALMGGIMCNFNNYSCLWNNMWSCNELNNVADAIKKAVISLENLIEKSKKRPK